MFDPVDAGLRRKIGAQTVIATDIARLRWLLTGLAEGYDRVVWCDADLMIFDEARFRLPGADYALGREVWVQPSGDSGWRVYVRGHNALLMFRRGNVFLDFYLDSAERLVRLKRGRMPPQYVGPKLLGALHNIVRCPVMETAGMLPPAVALDLLDGGGPALARYVAASAELPAGVNLCASLPEAARLDRGKLLRLAAALRALGGRERPPSVGQQQR